jgi:hypothetical protein
MDRDLLLRPNLATMDLRNHIDAELRVGRGRPLARALLLGGHGRGQPGGIGRWVGVECPLWQGRWPSPHGTRVRARAHPRPRVPTGTRLVHWRVVEVNLEVGVVRDSGLGRHGE